MGRQPTLQSLSNKLDEICALTALGAKAVLSMREAALLTGYSEGTLYRLTSNKEIPHYKKRGKLYFRKSELEEWLTDCRIASEQELSSKAATYIATH